MNAPLVPISVAFCIGVLSGFLAAPSVLIAWSVAGISAWCAWRWRRRFPYARPALLILWVCLGILRVLLWQTHPAAQLKEVIPDAPQRVRLHAVVADDPLKRTDPYAALDPSAPPSPQWGEGKGEGSWQQVGVLKLKHLRTPEGWRPIRGQLRATVESPSAPLRYGDEVLIEGQWSLVPSPGNPGQSDWRQALERKRIYGLLRVAPYDGVAIVRDGGGKPWLAAVFRLRQRWESLIREHVGPRDAGILLALLLGQQGELDEDLQEAFKETGTMHLLVISGSNVGMIAFALALFLRLLGVPWRLRLLIVAVGLGGYCLVVGLRPPVVRATLMAWIALGALALERTTNWSNILAAAALVMAWVDPSQLLDPGFQLSFGAVLSLLVFAARWRQWLEPHLEWVRPRWARRYVAISVSCTSAIWVGLWPVLAWYFFLVSPISMVANLLIVPLISVLVVWGAVGLIIATVAERFMGWTGPALSGLIDAMVVCVSWCQRLPGGHWYMGQPSGWLLLGYYGLMALSLLQRRLRWSTGRLLGCWLLAVNVWAWTAVASRAAASRWLTVEVLDVGHGDSIVVTTPGGHTVLIDAGTQEAGRRDVVPFLRWVGVRSLEALIITHPDADHLGGAIPVMEALRVKRLLTNGARDDTMAFSRVEAMAARRGIPRGILQGGMAIGEGTGLAIHTLHPPPGLIPGSEPGSNDNSVVLKLVRGEVSILLTGDLEEAGLPWLLAQEDALASAVLKVPHHGSALGLLSEEFIAAVRPELAIISVGRIHHLPAPSTLEALERVGAQVMLTRREGAVRVRTDGRSLDVTTGRDVR